MEYEIIFYHSGKTFEAERLLDRKLSGLHLTRRLSAAAVTPEELADQLSGCLSRCNIIVIIGGLDGGQQSTDSILSMILSAQGDSLHCEKLLDEEDNPAYYICAEQQCILVLPDDPAVMETMLDKRLLSVLKEKYVLGDEEQEEVPSMETVTAALQKDLSGLGQNTSDYHARLMAQQQTSLNKLRLLTLVSAGIGILLLIAAILTAFL
ncbi:MAG: hypothetical protein VZR73_04225 [Acutalibacteraceae bacterium]|nr:hypothetical protein [Acutalibacteraceae bacterium]